MDLAKYELSPLRAHGEISFHRARAPGNGGVLLVVSAESGTKGAARLEHEYALAGVLDKAWAASPVALDRSGGRTTLVLDDGGGAPIERQAGGPLDIERFLRQAVSLAAALGQAHRLGLIHKDVQPANLLIDPHGHVRLTGFGMSSRLLRERQEPAPPEIIAGSFAYMAPEQTGRMNRSIDARSDLYSLGVTLYEMLTGELPFAADDPMEWIHCHVARLPTPPSQRAPGIPAQVEAIVLQLMAKTPEDRYQTAAAVEADLRACLAALEARGTIDRFPLRAHDASERLLIPEKLYGRGAEIASLLAAFDQVVSEGTAQFVLVSGYSGVGKSSVVNELHKVLVPPRGLFAAGKFDQYKRDIPYATLAQAFQVLVRQLLCKSDGEVARWRAELQAALGTNGRLMVNLIPELALIIGEPPPVAELPPQEAHARFQMVLRQLLGVFARAEHPVALFLDDLQWLDTATLDFIEHLVTHPDVRHLLLIGAYRDNEVDATHALVRRLDAIRKDGVTARELVLAPLAPDDIGQMISDSVRAGRRTTDALAELVHEKSGGNPFFAIQFVSALEDEALLKFDHGLGAWTWNLAGIRAKSFTDNVVDLMAAKLRRLPEATQIALGQLACLGSVAEVTTLKVLAEELEAGLWEAVRAGLVLRSEESYAFLHDRVHEAAYALIAPDDRASAHLRIGRVLASRTAARDLDDKIFDIVNHLDRAADLIVLAEERERVAELNLRAGRRAMASSANVSALKYLATGAAFLGDDRWEKSRVLAFALEIGRAECELLTGHPELAEERLTALHQRAASRIEKAALTCLKVELYTSGARADEAVRECLEYLREGGEVWSAHPTDQDVRAAYDRIWAVLGDRPIEALADLPRMTDPTALATMEVLTKLMPAATFTDENLGVRVAMHMASISLEHGNTHASACGFVWVAMMAGPIFGDYASTVRFGQLGLTLVEERGLDAFAARVYLVFAIFVIPWIRHIRFGQEYLRRTFEAGTKSGDLTYSGYSFCNRVTNLIVCGAPLEEAERAALDGLAFTSKSRLPFVAELLIAQLRLIRSLQGRTAALGSFNGADFDETEHERRLYADPNLSMATCWYSVRKTQARFWASDPVAGLVAAAKAEEVMWTSRPFFEHAEYQFYAALTRAACCDPAKPETNAPHLEALAAHHRQLASWAKVCPDNFEDRTALVGAEIARIEGRELDAQRLYEEAIRLARQRDFVHNEATAHELAARFYAARGYDTIARAYLKEARNGYERWGAHGKVRQLEERHPYLQDEGRLAVKGTPGTPIGHLDLATVFKVSETVSAEIELDRVIDAVMVTVLEHAGADRSLLILPEGEGFEIAAEGTTVGRSVTVRRRRAPVTANELPESVFRYVCRTRASVLLDDAAQHGAVFNEDEYIRRNRSRSILALPLLKQGELVAVLYLENRLATRVFTPGRIAILRLLASQAAFALENARLISGLRRAEMYLAEAQRLSRTGSFGWSVARRELVWSEETFEIFALERTTRPTLELLLERTHRDDVERVEAFIARGAQLDNDWELDCRLLLPDGEMKDLHVVGHAVRERGELEFVGAVMDVTAAKRAEAGLRESVREKEALLREVHHRVKNNLQLISSMLSLQAARTPDPSVVELLADSRNRVRSMALVHENLYHAGNFARIAMAPHLQKLCAQLVRALGLPGRDITLTTAIDDIELDLDRAVSVGLIINELVSNAAKHAFPGGRAGCVRVELKRLRPSRCALAVVDDGVGMGPDLDIGHRESLGLQLIRDLTDQLHGTMTVSRGGGTSFTVTFDGD